MDELNDECKEEELKWTEIECYSKVKKKCLKSLQILWMDGWMDGYIESF